MTEGWETFRSFDDQASAEALAERLRIDGVPAFVEGENPVPGLGSFHVLVPTDLAHRARWIMAEVESMGDELNYLATGELGRD